MEKDILLLYCNKYKTITKIARKNHIIYAMTIDPGTLFVETEMIEIMQIKIVKNLQNFVWQSIKRWIHIKTINIQNLLILSLRTNLL